MERKKGIKREIKILNNHNNYKNKIKKILKLNIKKKVKKN